MSQGPRSRRKGGAAHGEARRAKRWASAARRTSRSAAARPRRRAGASAHGRPARDSHARSRQVRRKSRPRSPAVRAVSGVPFGLMDWIRRSMSGAPGPRANREVFQHSDFIFRIVKGPNRRNDYHLDPYDEIFYQLKGPVWVHLIGQGGKERVAEVREGGVLLVSAFTPHSPRRPPGSIGLVVERPRAAKEMDGIAWYCEGCGNSLHEMWLPRQELESGLAEALRAFNADLSRRTCRRCGAVLPDPAEHPPWRRHLDRRRN